MFPSAVAATTKAREQAIEKGGVGVLCIATTAADPDTAAGGYAFKIKEECMLFQDKFYDCKNREELINILRVGSIRKMFYITYNHRQLGLTDEWLRETIIRVGCTEEEAARDYYSIWKRGSKRLERYQLMLLKLLVDTPAETVGRQRQEQQERAASAIAQDVCA